MARRLLLVASEPWMALHILMVEHIKRITFYDTRKFYETPNTGCRKATTPGHLGPSGCFAAEVQEPPVGVESVCL